MKLKITDAAGTEVREISGTVLANSNKAGIQSACWDLRVQPNPAPPPAAGGGGAGQAGLARRAGRCGRSGRCAAPEPPAASPFGAGCPVGGGRRWRRRLRRRRRNLTGPFVLAGVYTVSLVVDGKTIETKPLRVDDDPEVVLTAVERKQMFDMAMEMHDTAAAADRSRRRRTRR